MDWWGSGSKACRSATSFACSLYRHREPTHLRRSYLKKSIRTRENEIGLLCVKNQHFCVCMSISRTNFLILLHLKHSFVFDTHGSVIIHICHLNVDLHRRFQLDTLLILSQDHQDVLMHTQLHQNTET